MINISFTSKPFIVFSIFFVLLGSVIGSIWMMNIYGFNLFKNESKIFPLHKITLIDGFLTLIIIGVGFMIIPRFRNIPNPTLKTGYAILVLIISTIILSIISQPSKDSESNIILFSLELPYLTILLPKFIGVSIFVVKIILMLRIKPKLLVLSDYFIFIAILILFLQNIIDLYLQDKISYSIIYFQFWFLFPIIMIFGIEYKTMPSFLGYIRPRKKTAVLSLLSSIIGATSGFLYLLGMEFVYLEYLFETTLVFSSTTFIISNFIFGGFDFGKIIQFTKNENRLRYLYIQLHIVISFLFLLSGIVSSICYYIFPNSDLIFLFYDMSIHFISIGFIGITILLYLPLMLPPILGKMIQISYFSFIPLCFVITSLVLRVVGDLLISIKYVSFKTEIQNDVMFSLFGFSGWLIVFAVISFLLITRKSIINSTSKDG
ncbi:MAG: hypothetical protein DA328_00650 [Nitrososphaeraceae archaeon]|nr:hypothetical protein [Nitrososphaeraceae archaeon]